MKRTFFWTIWSLLIHVELIQRPPWLRYSLNGWVHVKKFRTRSGQIFVVRVGSGQPSLVRGWHWKISPYKILNFQFFALRFKKISSCRVKSSWVKAGSAYYLLRVKSMLRSGQGLSNSLWYMLIIHSEYSG